MYFTYNMCRLPFLLKKAIFIIKKVWETYTSVDFPENTIVNNKDIHCTTVNWDILAVFCKNVDV